MATPPPARKKLPFGIVPQFPVPTKKEPAQEIPQEAHGDDHHEDDAVVGKVHGGKRMIDWNDPNSVYHMKIATAVIGAVVAVFFVILVNWLDLRQRKLADEKRRVEVQAAEERRVVDLKVAEGKLAEANRKAEEAAARAAGVDQRTKAREITPEQSRILRNQLKPTLPAPIEVSYGEADSEQKKYAEQIVAELRAAGFTVATKTALHMMTPYADGVAFEVNKNPPYPANAAALQNAFNAAGIAAEWHGTDGMAAGKIWLVIGKKP